MFQVDTEEELQQIEEMKEPIMEEAIKAYRHITAVDEFKEIEPLGDKQEKFDEKYLTPWAKKHEVDRAKYWSGKTITITRKWEDLSNKEKCAWLTPIPDGTFNADLYGVNNKGIKIAYIAKEPPLYDQNNYRTNTDYHNGEYWSWLQRIACGILNDIYKIEDIAKPCNHNDYDEMCCTSAWINLQKI